MYQFSSVAQSCPTLCDPTGCSTPGLPVHHQFPESTQTRVHWVGDAIQLSHPLSSPSPPAFNLSQHQGFSNESVLCIRWPKDCSSHQVAKGLEFQLQHQSFQWIVRIDFLWDWQIRMGIKKNNNKINWFSSPTRGGEHFWNLWTMIQILRTEQNLE